MEIEQNEANLLLNSSVMIKKSKFNPKNILIKINSSNNQRKRKIMKWEEVEQRNARSNAKKILPLLDNVELKLNK